jgi:N-acetylneuraminate synthase
MDNALTENNIKHETNHDSLIEEAILKLRIFLQKNDFTPGHYNHIELSCHSGLGEFRSTGSYFIDYSRHPYIKKIIVMLPGQYHPSHRHPDRSELYSMVSGDLTLTVEDKAVRLKEGQRHLVDKNKYHEFSTVNGAIFEEISYTENPANSEYKDDKINKIDRSKRIIRIRGKIL